MSNKLKRFSLVYEPKYSSSQYIVDFSKKNIDEYEIHSIEVEKYKGIISSKKGKFSLLDIDKFTTFFTDESDLKNYIGVHSELHSLFISLPVKGYINKINPVFYNEELVSKFKFIKDDKVCDIKGIEKMQSELLSIDSTFFKFYKESSSYKSKTFIRLIEEARMCKKELDNWQNSETADLLDYLKESIKNELFKYHHYREVLLAKQEYDKIAKDKIKDIEKPKIKVKKLEAPNFKPLEVEEQLMIEGFPKD